HDQALAIEKIRTGEVAATVFVAGKPATAVSDLKADYGLRLLNVPYDAALQESYLPATFSAEDYPALVDAETPVRSIAVGAVMAVYNWPSDTDRYRRVSQFVDTFFASIHRFRKAPRHPKWREVNLGAELPGWTRFSAAQTWLAENALEGRDRLKVSFSAFLDQNVAAADVSSGPLDQDALFEKFLEWRRGRAGVQ
ncbi:MAG: hypothetical protein AAGJ70_05440, partial [Pseudomonadota bacterium]